MKSLFRFFILTSIVFGCNSDLDNANENREEVNDSADVDAHCTVHTGSVIDSSTVSDCSIFIELPKMDVLYKGVDNALRISVDDPNRNVRVSISNGTISKRDQGNYMVRVTAQNKSKIVVSDMEGNMILEKIFEVRSVPDPKPYFAGKSYGDHKVSRVQLLAAQGLAAKMDNFQFDIKFTVISFKVTTIIGVIPVEEISNSNRVTEDMKAMFKKAKLGTVVTISNIKVKGADGTIRSLGGIFLKLQ